MTELKQSSKSAFERFYQGSNFFNITLNGDTLIVHLSAPKYVKDAYLAAQKRINDLCLPLEAKLAGHERLSNIFIVKEINQNSFERLSEQIGVIHA